MSKISIIIPVYNAEKYLKKCLDSVINQTYKDLEIICVNDGSIDNSLNILKEYKKKESRIIIIDKKNQGVSAARNDGIKKATGEYITFLDSDDWVELNTIEMLYNTLIKNKVDVVRCNYYINYNYNENLSGGSLYDLSNKKILTNDKKFGDLVVDRLLDGTIPCYTGLLLIKQKCLVDIKFKENIKLMEDTIFYNELMNKIYSIYFLDESFYHYYCNQESCTKSKDFYIRNMYNLIEVNKYLTDIIKKGRFYTDVRLKKMNAKHMNLIMNHFFIMYKESFKDKIELVNEINKILENKDVIKLINETDLSYLPFHLRICIKLIIKKKFNKLFIFYKFRYCLSVIKDKILKR